MPESTATSPFARNLERAAGYLERFRAAPLDHLVAGTPYAGAGAPGAGGAAVASATFDDRSPADGSLLAEVRAGEAAAIDTAATAAAEAFRAWRAVSGAERRRLLHRIADLVERRADEIALVESMDTGQPIRFMSKAAARGAENFRFFADRTPSAGEGQALPTDTHLNYTLRQPIGPVGVITPWNTPFMLATWKIAPALAAGCTVVHKPAEWSPLTATLLAEIVAEIMVEAGLPPGVVNVVHGMGEVAGKTLTEHPAIRAIAFVGESATGSAIMAQGAATLKRVHFELGGKNPVLVFDDARLERAIDAAVLMIYSLNGERCTSSSRLLVQRSVHDRVVESIAARLGRIRVGHPLDPDTEIGPLIHERHRTKVEGYVALAREAGLDVRSGPADASARDGSPIRDLVPPTLLIGATNDMRVAREEIFGPVLTVIPFDDEAEALALANDTPYGLAAYVWTTDVTRAHRLARDLEAGMIWVNSENVRHLPTPFGGMKASGIGRDGGDFSFDFYMETKNVCVALGEHRIPRLGSS